MVNMDKKIFTVVILSFFAVHSVLSQRNGSSNLTGTKLFPVRIDTPAPKHIDIVAGIENVKEITLADIASDISYVKLEDHPDLQFSILSISIIDNYFLVSSIDGLFIFGLDGKFVKQVFSNQHESFFVQDEITGQIGSGFYAFDGIMSAWYSPNEKIIKSFSRGTGYGTGGLSNRSGFKIIEPTAFTIDYPAEIALEMMKRVEIIKNPVPNRFSTSTAKMISVGFGLNSAIESSVLLSGSASNREAIGFGDGFVVAHYNNPSGIGMECVTFANNGDTLCRFPITADRNVWRPGQGGPSPPPEMHYYYNVLYTFRYLYNDTVFRIASPNVIQPVYVIDFGKYRIFPEVVIPRTGELKGYMMCSSMLEDDYYVYLRFNEGFDSGNNQRDGIVKFWWGLFHKDNEIFSVLPVNSNTSSFNGITNDLDGGMPFWPQHIDGQGRKIAVLQGYDIYQMKNTLTDQWFENSEALFPEKKEDLKQFVKSLNVTDKVIVVVK